MDVKFSGFLQAGMTNEQRKIAQTRKYLQENSLNEVLFENSFQKNLRNLKSLFTYAGTGYWIRIWWAPLYRNQGHCLSYNRHGFHYFQLFCLDIWWNEI